MPPDDPLDPRDPLGIGGRPGLATAGHGPRGDGPESIDVVMSVGTLDPVVVTLRDFLHRSGATRAIALLPPELEQDPPRLVDCGRLQPVQVTSQGRTVQLPHAVPLDAPGLPMYDVRMLPPFEVRAREGRIAAPLGGVEHYGFAVRSLAAALATLGEGAVALITFNTTDPEAPLSLTARLGDPIVLSLGDEEYEMEPGWPETLPVQPDAPPPDGLSG